MQTVTNFNKYICYADTTIFQAMKKIENLGNKGSIRGRVNMFLLIVNKNNVLLGTLTDGDMRRGIISGLNIDSFVDKCMQTNPITGLFDDDKNNKNILNEMDDGIDFLPILDAKDCLIKILINSPNKFELNAIIMAGGFGKRLGSLTKNTPKPLLHIEGLPIMERILSDIENNKYFRKIFISTHYLSDKIEEYINKRNNLIDIKIIKEEVPLGTAGSIQYIENFDKNHLLVVNGDILINLNFSSLVNFHIQNKFDATIAVARHEVKVPFGVIDFDKAGDFLDIREKPSIINYVSSGIYILSPKFQELCKTKHKLDMPELLSLGRSMNLKIGIFPLHEKWVDIGNIEDFKKIN